MWWYLLFWHLELASKKLSSRIQGGRGQRRLTAAPLLPVMQLHCQARKASSCFINSEWETSQKYPSILVVNMLRTKLSIIPKPIFKIRKEVYLPLQLLTSTPKHCCCFCHLAPVTAFGTSVFLTHTCMDLLFYHSLLSIVGETFQNRGLQQFHTSVPKGLGVGMHQAELSLLLSMTRLFDTWTLSHFVHHFVLTFITGSVKSWAPAAHLEQAQCCPEAVSMMHRCFLQLQCLEHTWAGQLLLCTSHKAPGQHFQLRGQV